jgi:hypothetical protein
VPGLISAETCGRVRLVITDGDAQEYTQLDAAIQLVFKNAKRRRCAWHAVYKGFERHVGRLGGEATDAFKVGATVCHRLYLMTIDVETNEEYFW